MFVWLANYDPVILFLVNNQKFLYVLFQILAAARGGFICFTQVFVSVYNSKVSMFNLHLPPQV